MERLWAPWRLEYVQTADEQEGCVFCAAMDDERAFVLLNKFPYTSGHLLVVHEAVQAAGFGAEIAASVAEELGVKVARLGAPRIPAGYAQPLEDESRVSAAKIAAAAKKLLG